MRLTVISTVPTQLSLYANPDQLRTRKSGSNLHLCCVLADQLQIPFTDGDDDRAFIVLAIDTRCQVLSIKDRGNGIGRRVFKLASLSSGQTFTLIPPDLSISGVSFEVLQRVLSQACSTNV